MDMERPAKKSKNSDDSGNQVWHLSGRWSLPKDGSIPLEVFKNNYKDLISAFKMFGIDKFVFQLEMTVGDEPERENWHYQIYAHVAEKIRPKTLGQRMNDEFRGIEWSHASTAGRVALEKYCMKHDTRQAGPWADKRIYMGKDLPTTLKRWQQQLKDYVTAPPDDRTLLWITDKSGGNGKTKFAKYMAFHHDGIPLGYGNAGDILNLVYKFQGKNLYMFNLTRTKPAVFSSQDIYSCLESIKDGMFINTKYDTGFVLMDSPHVVVFANQDPDQEHCTADRWSVHQLDFGVLNPALNISHASGTAEATFQGGSINSRASEGMEIIHNSVP